MTIKTVVTTPIWDDDYQSTYTEDWIYSFLQDAKSDELLVIVDNASPSFRTKDILESVNDPRFHVIYNAKNVGYGAAANQGVAYGIERGAEFAIITNNDIMILNPEWIEESFVRYLREHHDWLMGGRFIADNGWTDFGQEGGRIPYLEGYLLAFHRELWNNLGGFDENMLAYFEDVDLSLRAVRAGYELVQSPRFTWLSNGNLQAAIFSGGDIHHIGGQTGYLSQDRFDSMKVTMDSARYLQKKFGFPRCPVG